MGAVSRMGAVRNLPMIARDVGLLLIWLRACLATGIFFCCLPNYSASVNSQGMAKTEAEVVFGCTWLRLLCDSSWFSPSTRLLLSQPTLNLSCNTLELAPVRAKWRNMASFSSVQMCLPSERPCCNFNSVQSLRKTCFAIPSCSCMRIGDE